MSEFKIKEIKRRIQENEIAEVTTWCFSCGQLKSKAGNKCTICYQIDLRQFMRESEFEAYQDEEIKGMRFV